MSGNPFLDDLHGDIIQPGVFDNRTTELLAKDLSELNEYELADHVEALDEIARFRSEVIATVGDDRAWDDSSGMISESYFDQYVNDDVEGMVGSDTLSILDRYLDWEKIKDDYTDKFEMIEFDGVNYFADKAGF